MPDDAAPLPMDLYSETPGERIDLLVSREVPRQIDLLLEVPDAKDPSRPTKPIDSRLRIGSPRTDRSSARTDDEFVQQVLQAIPAPQRPTFAPAGGGTRLPAPEDSYADVKRSLAYSGPVGVNLASEGHFSKYLGGDEVSRIVDGSFRIYAVDQNAGAPTLSYLRLGKAEPQLTMRVDVNDPGSPAIQLPKRLDRARDSKYSSGIGVHTEGEIQVYSKGKTNFRSSGPFLITSRGYSLSAYGEQKSLSYDIPDAGQLAAVEAGEVDETDVKRTLVSVDWRHKRGDNWWQQVYERGRRVDFYTSAKGEVGIAAKYALAMGASFNHSVSVGLETGFSAAVEVKGSASVKVHENGFDTDTPLGKFSCGEELELGATRKVELKCASFIDIALSESMQNYANVVRAAVAAQNAVFLAWEAALADRANMTLGENDKPADMDVEDQHNFRTEFHKGPDIYNAAISLSAITTTAGILLAAVQAVLSKLPATGPKIEMDPFGITISVGPTSQIKLDAFGIETLGMTNTQRAVSVAVQSPMTSISP